MRKYIKMLLPALLVAVLVGDGIFAYQHPKAGKVGTDNSVAAEAAAKVEMPELKLKEQKKEEKIEPKGTGGDLAKISEPSSYKDGTYTGSARGFGGNITVKVVVKGGRIASVTVVSAPGEDGPYLAKAMKLTGRIVKKQSTNVDAVSGATYSSNGIIKAVRKALAKAGGSSGAKDGKDKKDNAKVKPSPEKKTPKKPAGVTEGDWADGTYTGSGEGFGGKLTVKVVIKNGKIVSLTVEKNKEDAEYLAKAKKAILPGIVKKQGTNVDTVSGATFSSVGILEAVNNALKKAVKNTGGGSTAEEKPVAPPEQKESRVTKVVRIYCDEDEDFEDYDLKITFVLNDKGIIGIEDAVQVVPEPSNDSYIKAAVNGIKVQMKSKPDFKGIDTVSGATCTAMGIIRGAGQALAESK